MRWMKREDDMDEEEVVVVEIEAGHPLKFFTIIDRDNIAQIP